MTTRTIQIDIQDYDYFDGTFGEGIATFNLSFSDHLNADVGGIDGWALDSAELAHLKINGLKLNYYQVEAAVGREALQRVQEHVAAREDLHTADHLKAA